MFLPTRTLEQLEEDKKVMQESPPFEPSFQGFLMNVGTSLREGLITHEQKNRLIGLSRTSNKQE